MGWKNLGEKPVVGTPWFRLNLAEVELPGGRRLDHYALWLPPVVLAAVLDAEDRVLMLWRHRFIPDTHGWEIPSGIADPAETLLSPPPRFAPTPALAAAAAREACKESGWEPQGLEPLIRLEAASGLSDSVNHVYWTRGPPVSLRGPAS
jgi:8-oxo-dGTP pyrophosphatase MutT (NUDIX family)